MVKKKATTDTVIPPVTRRKYTTVRIQNDVENSIINTETGNGMLLRATQGRIRKHLDVSQRAFSPHRTFKAG